MSFMIYSYIIIFIKFPFFFIPVNFIILHRFHIDALTESAILIYISYIIINYFIIKTVIIFLYLSYLYFEL